MKDAMRSGESTVEARQESSRRAKKRLSQHCSICARRTWFDPIFLMEPEGAPEPRHSWILCKDCYGALLSEMRRSPVHPPHAHRHVGVCRKIAPHHSINLSLSTLTFYEQGDFCARILRNRRSAFCIVSRYPPVRPSPPQRRNDAFRQQVKNYQEEPPVQDQVQAVAAKLNCDVLLCRLEQERSNDGP